MYYYMKMENTTVLLFILVLNCSGAILNICRDDQLAVSSSDHNITCIKCPVCPPGSGVTVACGSTVPYNASVDCKPCMQGTFSDSFTSESCKPCSKCKSTEVLDALCTNVSDTRCSCKACPKGYYRNQTTSQCLPCSQCCSGDVIIKQCTNQGIAHTQSCGYQKRNQCLAKCWYDEVTVVFKDGKTRCLPCPICMAGLGLTAPCGSTVREEISVTCQRPLLGETFVNQQGILQQCNVCPRGHEVLVNCSLDSDIICGNCTDGFYFEELSLSCQECFWCCKHHDTTDVKQCVRQAMSFVKESDFLPVFLPSHFHFLYVSQLHTLGQVEDNHNSQESWRLERKALITSLAAVATFALGCLIFKVRKGPATCTKQDVVKKPLKHALGKEDVKVPTLTNLKNCHPENKAAQQDATLVANCERQELEYPQIVSPGHAVFRKTGVEVLFQDLDKKYMQGLCLQACVGESSQACLLDKGELLLSPIMNFVQHSKAEKAVKVLIPHGANVILSPEGWFIRLKEFYSNHWFNASCPQASTDYFENQRVHRFAVNSNHVEFETSNLSTFAVVATYDSSAAPVLKRMKTAAFCDEPTAGEDVCFRVYCFDDCEWSYERLMEEEKHKGGNLLTSLESFDFSVSCNQDVEINVPQVDGWNLDQASIPKKFSHTLLRNSFNTLSTPCCALVFHPNSQVEKSFFAMIGVTQSSSKTMMYAGVTVKKDPTVPATSVHLKREENIHNASLERFVQFKETSGTKALFSISEKVLQEVALTLDMLPKGVGNWRHLARKLGVCKEEIEMFGREYLDPDGSPSTFLLQRIKETHPNITTGEFCRILLEMKREDAVKCITTELEKINQQQPRDHCVSEV